MYYLSLKRLPPNSFISIVILCYSLTNRKTPRHPPTILLSPIVVHLSMLFTHHALRFKQVLKNKCNGNAHYYPTDYCGEMQVVITSLGAAAKSNVGRYLDESLEEEGNLKMWTSNKPSPCDRMVLRTRWLAQA